MSPRQADLRWDPDAGLDYEVVESTLGVLISHCVARHTAAAEDPGHADPAAEVWLQRLQFYAQQRHEMKTLLSRDPGALRDARARYAPGAARAHRVVTGPRSGGREGGGEWGTEPPAGGTTPPVSSCPPPTNEQLFHAVIVHAEFADAQTVDAALFTGGTRMGKSHLKALLGEEFGGAGYADIGTDTLRVYHPRWRELLETDDVTAGHYTQLDAQAWVARSVTYAIERRLNVILDSTLSRATEVTGYLERSRPTPTPLNSPSWPHRWRCRGWATSSATNAAAATRATAGFAARTLRSHRRMRSAIGPATSTFPTAGRRVGYDDVNLVAHEVGAGKTAELVIGVMELRRLGLVRKPAGPDLLYAVDLVGHRPPTATHPATSYLGRRSRHPQRPPPALPPGPDRAGAVAVSGGRSRAARASGAPPPPGDYPTRGPHRPGQTPGGALRSTDSGRHQ